ncbi:MAG: hypothetical protein LBL15_03820, partial [Oscillospiraceae bacterium]|jgi:hypothetical protein|nr:hypothetical protein [Oscillospiraceae bacterium]
VLEVDPDGAVRIIGAGGPVTVTAVQAGNASVRGMTAELGITVTGETCVVTIPSGTQALSTAPELLDTPQDLGRVTCVKTAYPFPHSKMVLVTVASAKDYKLELGGWSGGAPVPAVAYSLSDTAWGFPGVGSFDHALTATVTDMNAAAYAGTYSDTLTFTVVFEPASG